MISGFSSAAAEDGGDEDMPRACVFMRRQLLDHPRRYSPPRF